MEYVHKQTINFRDDRTPLQRRVSIGYEGDNLVERLEFVLPELVGGQVAKLMITGADAIALNRVDDGRYAADLTREMIGPDSKRDAYVRIDGVSGQIWQSALLRIVTGKLPDVEEEIEKVYPTAVGQMLTAMAEHTGEMEAQEERVERAAQRAEEAAERAETGGGSGGPGEDGGYYQPSVTDGVLSWAASKTDMPSVPESDIRGPKGDPGKDGKTAYQYAQNGGYEGTEAEFAAKLAQEIPEAYTLPVATADRLGGVKVGEGLMMDGEALGVEPEGEFELIETITVEEEVSRVVRSQEPDGTPYNLKKIYIDITTPQQSEKKVGVVSFNLDSIIPAFYISNMLETNTDGARAKVLCWIENNNVLRTDGACGINAGSQLAWTNAVPYLDGFAVYGEANIHFFQFTIVSGVIPAGTTIKIMGVRA